MVAAAIKKKRSKASAAWIIIAALFAVCYIYFVHLKGNVEYRDLLLFLAAQIAYAVIPGMAILIHINLPRDRTVLLIVSYMLGIGVVIGEYFLFNAIGLGNQLFLCMSVVSVVCLLFIIARGDKLVRIKPVSGSFPAYFALLAAMLIAVLFITLPNYQTPDLSAGGYSRIYQDLLWNTGNTTAISWGTPVMDIHVNGFTFGYHYFVQVFLAAFKNILGISSYVLNFKMLAVLQVIVFTGGFYLLNSLLFKNRWAVMLCSAAGMACSYLLLNHLFFNAYATPVGIGLTLAAAYYFIRYIKRMEQAKALDKDFVMFLLLLAIATGVKTLFPAGMVAGACILMLIQLIRRKNPGVMLLSGLLTVVVFLGVFLVMSYGTHTFNGLQTAFASIMWSSPPPYYTAALEYFGGSLPEAAIKLISYPLYMLINYPAVVVSVLMLIVYLARRRGGERGNSLALFLLFSIIAGFVATSIFFQPGMSNILFMEGTIPLCAFSVFYVTRSYTASALNKKSAKIALCIFLSAAFAYTAGNNIYAIRNDALIAQAHSQGQVDAYNAISRDEYEAMLWLKDNTTPYSVFACDRQYYVPVEDLTNARYYYYTAFSERQCYLEGYNYVNTYEPAFEDIITERLGVLRGVYANDAAAIARLQSEGVNYLVVSTLIHPEFSLDPAYGQNVFQNAGVAIYDITPPAPDNADNSVPEEAAN